MLETGRDRKEFERNTERPRLQPEPSTYASRQREKPEKTGGNSRKAGGKRQVPVDRERPGERAKAKKTLCLREFLALPTSTCRAAVRTMKRLAPQIRIEPITLRLTGPLARMSWACFGVASKQRNSGLAAC